jgi:hypothetical protein
VFVSTVVRCEGNVDDCLVVESVTMECVVDGNCVCTSGGWFKCTV